MFSTEELIKLKYIELINESKDYSKRYKSFIMANQNSILVTKYLEYVEINTSGKYDVRYELNGNISYKHNLDYNVVYKKEKECYLTRFNFIEELKCHFIKNNYDCSVSGIVIDNILINKESEREIYLYRIKVRYKDTVYISEAVNENEILNISGEYR